MQNAGVVLMGMFDVANGSDARLAERPGECGGPCRFWIRACRLMGSWRARMRARWWMGLCRPVKQDCRMFGCGVVGVKSHDVEKATREGE